MSSKGVCTSCNRKVLQTTSDICMYCGAPLLASQRFTKEEKEQIVSRQEKQLDDEKRAIEKSKAKNSEPGLDPFNISSNGSDFSGGDYG